MHPNRAFAWEDRDAALRFAADRAFVHVFTACEDGMFVVHVPILVTDDGRVYFTSPAAIALPSTWQTGPS